MASWYVKTDAENKIIEMKARGRGRPPRDFISWDGEGAPVIGEEINPDDLIKKDTPKPKKAVKESGEATPKIKQYDIKLTETGGYERDAEGLVYKVVKRGRPAAGWKRISADEFIKALGQKEPDSTEMVVEEGNNSEEVMPTIKMEEAPVAAGTIPGVNSKTKVFEARKKATLSAVQATINFNNNPDKRDGIISMVAPNCIGRTEDLIEYLHLGWSGAKIDVHSGTGNVHIWVNHPHGDPDFILEGAIIEES